MSKDILNIIYKSFDQIVSDLNPDDLIEKSEQTIIYGPSSIFDSLGLANFLLTVEKATLQKYGVELCLVDEAIHISDANPFLTMGSLAEFVEGLIKKKQRN